MTAFHWSNLPTGYIQMLYRTEDRRFRIFIFLAESPIQSQKVSLAQKFPPPQGKFLQSIVNRVIILKIHAKCVNKQVIIKILNFLKMCNVIAVFETDIYTFISYEIELQREIHSICLSLQKFSERQFGHKELISISIYSLSS